MKVERKPGLLLSDKPKINKAERIRVFCREYIKDFNGTRSAKAAGIPEAGAHVAASRMLKNPKVQAELSKLVTRRANKALMEGEDILRTINQHAKADIRKLMNPDGTLLPPADWPEDVAQAINGLKVRTIKAPFTGEVIGHVTEFKMGEKLRALELLGKNKALFIDKIAHEGEVNHNIAVITPEQMKEMRAKFNKDY